MTEIVIHRCTAHVVRRGGWSWGPDRRRLLDGVLAAVPQLVLAELGPALADRRDRPATIAEPLRITIPVGLADLADLAGPAPRPLPTGDASPRSTVSDAVGRAVAEAGPTTDRPRSGGQSERPRPSPTGADRPTAVQLDLLDLLVDVHNRHGLVELLRLAPVAVVKRWHDAILGASTVARSSPGLTVIGAVLAARPADVDRLPPIARRLALAVAVTAELGAAPNQADVLAGLAALDQPKPAIERRRDAGDRPDPESATSVFGPPVTEQTVRTPSPTSIGTTHRQGPIRHTVDEVGVLPFLLLGPLAELGVLEAMAATVRTDEELLLLPALAAGLAYKSLSPPERGWRRAAGDYHTAAAYAGRIEPVPETELVALADRAEALVGGPAALLTRALIERDPSPKTVAIHAPASGGVVVADATDLAVLGWGPDESWLDEVLAQLDRPAVIVDAGDRLDLLIETISALDARRAVPLATDPTLERALAAMAGAAMATIATRLWGATEAPDPLLVLERMGDLSGSVELDPDRVKVTLPMGRRRADLFASGLMDDVTDVPWLGGRPVLFRGG